MINRGDTSLLDRFIIIVIVPITLLILGVSIIYRALISDFSHCEFNCGDSRGISLVDDRARLVQSNIRRSLVTFQLLFFLDLPY